MDRTTLDQTSVETHSSLRDIPLSISQVEMITGIPKTTLRYWEKIFQELLNPDRTGGNQRNYTLQDIQKVLTIKRLLKIEMYTVSGARRRLGLAAEQAPELMQEPPPPGS